MTGITLRNGEKTITREMVTEAIRWIEITSTCERFHVLPACGGVYDQDPRDIKYLNKTLDAILDYRAEQIKKESKNP